MPQLLSKQCEYALQAVTYLAARESDGRISIKELTSRLDIPSPFLAKILQDLVRKNLLSSLRGPTGGFALAKPSDSITLLDIVEAVDGTDFSQKCVMGFPECSGAHPCAVHDTWGRLRAEIVTMLSTHSIKHIAAETKKPEYHER
jgi:Rrf2 family transcriptional regulator, iron-sulfur cluster assembly transcription factor